MLLVRDSDHSIQLMLLSGVVGLACAIGTVIWLIRSVLPRTVRYSAFATKIADGDYSSRLDPAGSDELAQLGRVLDDLAERRQRDDADDRNQLELIDALQQLNSEYDARALLRRHLERVVPASTVTILERTDPTPGPTKPDQSEQSGTDNVTADPAQQCLTVQTGRPRLAFNQDDPLLPCPVCTSCPASTLCVPLIVTGEVIGSVLCNSPRAFGEREQRTVRDAVAQVAPVLSNLRTLALAELHATLDGLTGMPNRRSIDAITRRMVAQSARTLSPVAALMCDLDHFKRVNDRYGHARGDDVLTAAAAALNASIRSSDFAGRYGGEEFVVLLPNTDAAGATTIAEKIRTAIAAIQIPSVHEPVTISIGIAVLPDHALDATSLQSNADQALYAAKRAGRNRVHLFPSNPHEDPVATPKRADDDIHSVTPTYSR